MRQRHYQESMLQTVHEQLERWLEAEDFVSHEEVHRFLHSVKGTSGTIGLASLCDLTGELLRRAEPMDRDRWGPDELRAFLYPLVLESNEFRFDSDVLLTSSLGGEGEVPSDQPLVLILDDNVTLLRYLKDELEAHGYFVVATVSPDKAIHYFHDLTPDCFILDLIIPEKNGFEVMETLQERIRKKFVPTTMISIDNSKETRLKAYRMGADDYLHKPIDMDELLARMERQLWRKRQMDRLLFVDELTGALNRKCFEEMYRRLCFESQRMRKPFSLAVLDIDYFKQVNDRYGHLAGDKVLAGFAKFVTRETRAVDSFFRFGGEEFVLLMPQTGLADAEMLLNRTRERLANERFDAGTERIAVTFSAGVVEIEDALPETLESRLGMADAALYRAKEAGRDRVVVAEGPGEAPRSSQRKLNVAIVDDDAMIRAMLQEFVKESAGWRTNVDVRSFKDGPAFLADPRHEERTPYVVILDGVMPGMDGLEVLERVRAKPDADSYSVIMLTGRTGEADINRALELGADDYLTKPFRLRELDARIKRLMRRIR